MLRGFEYYARHKLLINHLTRFSIFDEISYLLSLTLLVDKIREHRPRYLLIIVKAKKIFNYDAKFSHWLELNLFPVMKEAGVEKIAFVIPFGNKKYKDPQFTENYTFTYLVFARSEEALEWFGIKDLNHLSGSESLSGEIPT